MKGHPLIAKRQLFANLHSSLNNRLWFDPIGAQIHDLTKLEVSITPPMWFYF